MKPLKRRRRDDEVPEKKVLIRKRKDMEENNEHVFEPHPKVFNLLTIEAPEYFVYGGYVFETIHESNGLITGQCMLPSIDNEPHPKKTTIKTALVVRMKKNHALGRLLFALSERRKQPISKSALHEVENAMIGVQRCICETHLAPGKE